MKTIKIIDLLNKIANGEIKDKTKFRIDFKNGLYRDFYYDKEEEVELNCLKNISDDYSLYDAISLNDEVEIIEEEQKNNFTGWKMYQDGKEVCSMDCSPEEDKKIEKISVKTNNHNVRKVANKINELIDEVNKLNGGNKYE